MTNHRTIQPDARKVIVGVDTHKHVHVAVAIDTRGVRLDDRSCAADSDGYQQLITWAERHGRIAAFGIEGTGSYGAGLTRAVRRAGHQVLEVTRGDRRTRRIAGKSDPVDAETAARSHNGGGDDGAPQPLISVKRPQFSWTLIRGESNVQGGGGNGSIEERAGEGVGGDGGSPEGDRSARRRRGR